MKKIIGLSCGRKNGNSEILLKEAAMGAEEMGIETEIIRASELRIEPCTNCQACAKAFREGREVKCVVKDDDADWIVEKTVVEDYGLIVSVPVYHLRSNGIFMLINDRMLPATMKHPEVLKKTRVGAIISVGGGGADWTSLGLLTANSFVQHTRVLVDQMQVNDAGSMGSVLSDYHQKSRERARQLGRNVARAMMMPIEEVKYVGEETAVSCPVCHCNVLQVPEKLPQVVCPVCWVHGTLYSDGNEMKVKWDEKDVRNPRFSEYGIAEHGRYISQVVKREKEAAQQEAVKELKKKYSAYGKIIKP